jgi:hypothetical protein
MNIDWNDAPEGATHFSPGNKDRSKYQAWWKPIAPGSSKYQCWAVGTSFGCGGWQPGPFGLPENAVKREWTGEGLPPVGTVCEYLWQWSDKIVYVRVKVLSHDEERAQFRVIQGGGIGSLRECNQRLEDGLPMFRPIRTPEQIAAEERLKAIDEMAAVYKSNYEGHVKDGCQALYDAGYRLQVKP